MRAVGYLLSGALLGSMAVLGAGREKLLRTDREKLLTREASELSAPEGADLETAEADAMAEFVDTRAFMNVGCQYATETIVILDNSMAMFDKELWMFKLLVKEIAAAFLRVNDASRFGLILTTAPDMPLIRPIGTQSQNITNIWQTVKGIQRTQTLTGWGDVTTATQTAIDAFDLNNTVVSKAYNVLLLVAPYAALRQQLAESALLFTDERIRRFVVGTRMTGTGYQVLLEGYAGCAGCGHVQYVGQCTPARFLFLIKRLYPIMCVPAMYYRDAAIMTFQIDGMPADDENLPEFVDKFLDVLSQGTGVEREYLEVLDVRDSSSTAGPQYNARRLKSMETFQDYPKDTLMDVVLRDSGAALRDTPFRIAGRLDTDLRNDLSPVASLFNNEFNGVPKVRNIQQPRESIFTRPSEGFTFQNLYLGDKLGRGLGNNLGDRKTLGEILSH